MSEFIKMGEMPLEECHILEQLIAQKDQLIIQCNGLQEQDQTQYKQAKLQLSELENTIKKQCHKIMIDYKVEVIPGANIRINFENGDILAVLPDEGQEKASDLQVF